MNKSTRVVALTSVLLTAGGLALALDHSSWDQVLKERCRDGRVDYATIKAQPAALESYLASLAATAPSDYESWSRDEKIAFWINAYNALTVKAILDRYPIRPSLVGSLRFPKNSIRQIPGIWDKIKFTVIGKQVTLDWIEHETLRKVFKEPRVHMALVCASVGCPPLRSEAYTGARLSEQLDDQARRFFSDPSKFRIDQKAGVIYLSPIFKWFGQDFVRDYTSAEGFADRGPADRSALSFAGRFVGSDDHGYLRNSKYQVKFLDYDWSLNEKASDR